MISDPARHKEVGDRLRAAIASLEADAARKDLKPEFRKSAQELAEKMRTSLFFHNKEAKAGRKRK